MTWLDVRHHYVDYEEPDNPPKRVRCRKCGRFLPKEPNGSFIFSIPNGHYEYIPKGDDDYDQLWVEDGPPIDTHEEPLWVCSCGESFESDDIF